MLLCVRYRMIQGVMMANNDAFEEYLVAWRDKLAWSFWSRVKGSDEFDLAEFDRECEADEKLS
jgi:hypothetical protein